MRTNLDLINEVSRNMLNTKDRKDILDAMFKIDRKYFVKEETLAYFNRPLEIGEGQTISQPSTVARMIQELKLKKGDDVLEIGAGSGWNAAVIAHLVNPGKVWTFEIHEDLVKFAKKNVRKLKLENLEIIHGNFREFEKELDKIIFTAGVQKGEEQEILKFAQIHLKEKGIMVCPYKLGPLIIVEKIKGELKVRYTFDEFLFVPLVLE